MAVTSDAIFREIEGAFGTARMEQLLDLLTELRRVSEALEPAREPDAAPIASADR